MHIVAATSPAVALAAAQGVSPTDAAARAGLHDLADALADTSLAVTITPATELDPCAYCPPLDGPAHHGEAVIAYQPAGSRWTHREPLCACCLRAAFREHDRAGASVWLELPIGGAR